MMASIMIGGSIVSSQQDGLDKLARHASMVLVFIAAVQLGMAALLWVAGEPAQKPLIVPNLVAGAVFGSLALWARRAPWPAVLVGLSLFLASIALSVVQGRSVTEGILGRALVAVLFVNGIGAARQYEDAKRRVSQQGREGQHGRAASPRRKG